MNADRSAPEPGSRRIQAIILPSVPTVESVSQVDLVPKRVAQLDPDKLTVPGPLHVLFAMTVGVRVGLEGELGPDGVFS